MTRSPPNTKWGAGAAVVALLLTFGAAVLIVAQGGSALAALSVCTLSFGLIGVLLRQTWGGFGTVGSAALVLVAIASGFLPAWIAFVAVAALAVSIPTIVRAFRFDAVAAATLFVVAAAGGAGAVLGFAQLAPPDVVEEYEVYKPKPPGAHSAYGFERWKWF